MTHRMKITTLKTMYLKALRLGFPLVCLGVITLVVGFFAGWTNSNALLLACAFVIILGAIMHVMSMKRESKY